jgi:uncharacterized protein
VPIFTSGAFMGVTNITEDQDRVVAWLEQAVKLLVHNPDNVRVSSFGRIQHVILEVRVEPSDVRRVIGRNGRYAEAIRALLEPIGGMYGKKYILEIVDYRS